MQISNDTPLKSASSGSPLTPKITQQPSDIKQRREALNPSASIICTAPAGSGKTELLTQRFLMLLSRVKRPEEVLAITFTRKAAGEMRERVVNALTSALDIPPKAQHALTTWQLAKQALKNDEQYQWSLLKNPSRLQIKTFDSLCASLAAAMPIESGMGALPEITEDSEFLYRLTIKQFLETLELDVPWAPAIENILSELDGNSQRLENLLVNMIARRESWLPIFGNASSIANAATQPSHFEKVIQTLEQHYQHVRHETIQKIISAIPSQHHNTLLQMVAFAAHNLNQNQSPSSDKKKIKTTPISQCKNIDLHAKTLPQADEEGILFWQALVHLLTTDKGQWRKKLDKRIGFPIGENFQEKFEFRVKKEQCLAIISIFEEIPGLLEQFNDIRFLPNSEFLPKQTELLKALVQALPVLCAYLILTFKEKNRVDFSEISIKALTALGDEGPSYLSLKLDYKIQHILVDEFQDTSSTQIRLLERLTEGWEESDQRTLFCVGDAMQSIYGFRGANVGLFLNSIHNGIGDTALSPIKLSTNFRSSSTIVNWINNTFQSAFPKQEDISTGAVEYFPSTAIDTPQPHKSYVNIHSFCEGKDLNDEAKTIVDIIRETQQHSPNDSIAILVRNRSHAKHIIPHLKQQHLSYRAVELESLTDEIIIQDLMALTHALLRPADRIAWLSILRAPWCGLSLVDLEIISQIYSDDNADPIILEQIDLALADKNSIQTEHTKFQQNDLFSSTPIKNARQTTNTPNHTLTLSDDGAYRLKRVLPVLKNALQNRQRHSLREWVEGTWISLGGPGCIEENTELNNANVFFDLLSRYNHAEDLPKYDTIIKATEQLFAVPDPHADEKLQIMTMHKSKGLEFDTVIIPALEKSPRPPEPELLRWYERLNAQGQAELLLAPITSTGSDKDAFNRYLSQQEQKKSHYETTRLLYVACTRAKKRLVLMAQLESDQAKGLKLKNPPKNSLLNTIWSSIKNDIINHSDPNANTESNLVSPKDTKFLKRFVTHWQPPKLPKRHLLDKYIPFSDHENQAFNPQNSHLEITSKAIGTIAHRALQLIGEKGPQAFHFFQQPTTPQLWKNQLSQLGVPQSKIGDALEKLTPIINSYAHDKTIKWILDDTHQRHCEFPITVVKEAGYQNYIIDLVLLANNRTWIIDYKTSQPQQGEPVDIFIKNEKLTYKNKMVNYKNGLRKQGFSNITIALYFPLIQTLTLYDS